eukprot:SAG11_NODE_361_length_10183_cov_4.077053_4_plen_201_part_00
MAADHLEVQELQRLRAENRAQAATIRQQLEVIRAKDEAIRMLQEAEQAVCHNDHTVLAATSHPAIASSRNNATAGCIVQEGVVPGEGFVSSGLDAATASENPGFEDEEEAGDEEHAADAAGGSIETLRPVEALDAAAVQRYSRQLILPSFRAEGQVCLGCGRSRQICWIQIAAVDANCCLPHQCHSATSFGQISWCTCLP